MGAALQVVIGSQETRKEKSHKEVLIEAGTGILIEVVDVLMAKK